MAMQHKTIDDFCRLCAIESETGVIIYSTEGESLCLEEKIINCLRIEVSRDDMLPKKVCQSCSTLLEDYYRFSERATQVQQTLAFLLGLRIRHIQEQEAAEMCLMQANVKMESNVIKNELDELIVHQGNIQVEGEKFDLTSEQQSLVPPEEDYQSQQMHRRKMMDEPLDERQVLMDEEDYTTTNGLDVAAGSDNTPRHIHRRKMLQPKKAAAPDKVPLDQHLTNMDGIDCLMGESEGSQDDFKSEEFNENDLFQDLDDEENNDENLEVNIKDEEEEEQVEVEWRKHWGITCDQCQSIFPNKSIFEKHYRLTYNKKPVYTCSFCKKSMNKYSTYRSHCYRHIYDGRFKCKFCDKRFCMKGMLDVHILSRHGPVRPFICEECGVGFVTFSRLSSHQKRHKTQEELRCTECGKVLQTRGGLAAHMTVHKLGRRFMCHLCGKTFTQKINMQQHVKHHKGEKPYSCDDCGKSFAEKSHLNRHKSFHTLDRPYQCPVCKKMYKTERCLKVHSQVHLNTRPYVCSYCNKGFLSSTKLKQHYNCHTGERPFACKYCERTFTNYPNWLKHTRRRHKVDHKTGLSLKEEVRPQNVMDIETTTERVDVLNSGIEFIEIPDVEVKEDGRDSVHSQHSIITSHGQSSHLVAQSIMSQFQVAQDAAASQFQMHMVPELVAQQHVYTDHVMGHHMMPL